MSQSADRNRTVNPRIRLNSADSIISEDAIANKDSNPENRFDDLADQIINTFIVKKQERLIDREEHRENISYEESEIRLIYLGIFSASFLGMVSLVLTILFGLQALSTNQVIILNVPKPKEFSKPLVPQVLIMNRLGQGQMATFEFHDKNQSFELAWEFKLPRIPDDTGYYLFEDQGNIYSVPSSTNIKITMLNEFKHQTIYRSQIPDKFYFSGTILQVGHFVMIFGGSYKLLEDLSTWTTLTTEIWFCSSVRISEYYNEQVPSMAIWNIKRQVWFKGPYIPFPCHCIDHSSGFAVNRSHGVVLISSESCIHSFTISFSTFQWVSDIMCLIDVNTYGDHGIVSGIVSTSFINSKQTNNLTVVILSKVKFSTDDKQLLFLLDYYAGYVTPMGPFEPYDTFKVVEFESFPISLFTLRNRVYLVWMQQSPLNDIKFFEFSSNNTFVFRQTIQDLNMKKLLGITDKVYKIITVPFY